MKRTSGLANSPPAKYREFVEFVFDRPECDTHASEAWYFAEDFVSDFDATNPEIVELYTHLMRNCGRDLAHFTDTQVALGLSYLFNNSCGSLMFAFHSDEVAMDRRLTALAAMEFLYRDCLDVRCAPLLGDINEISGLPLNGICYMLWDVTPLNFWEATRNRDMEPVADTIFSVLEGGLSSRNDATVESVLHGLGHRKYRYPKRVEAIIDKFLLQRKDLRPELLQYAKAARTGMIN